MSWNSLNRPWMESCSETVVRQIHRNPHNRRGKNKNLVNNPVNSLARNPVNSLASNPANSVASNPANSLASNPVNSLASNLVSLVHLTVGVGLRMVLVVFLTRIPQATH